MSDFDTVLERLLAEPAFAAALGADPDGALVGYRLDADEVALLRTQLTGDAGGEHAVEVRATQSSMFGLLTPLAGMVGGPGGGGFATATGHIGPGVPPVGGGAFLPVAAVEGFGGVAAAEGFGAADPVQGFGAADPVQGFGAAATAGPSTAMVRGLAAAPLPAEPPPGYRTRVDVDGDGAWDRHVLAGRADGGVDILVDLNRDGATDFVGRDADADGLVDSAHYDVDRDGVFDRRATDDNGDGWLDRRVPLPDPTALGPDLGAGN